MGPRDLTPGASLEERTAKRVHRLDQRLGGLEVRGVRSQQIASKRVVEITGDGSKTVFNVAHQMASRDVQVQVVESAAPYGGAPAHTITRPTKNQVRVTFSSAPANGTKYRVIVIG